MSKEITELKEQLKVLSDKLSELDSNKLEMVDKVEEDKDKKEIEIKTDVVKEEVKEVKEVKEEILKTRPTESIKKCPMSESVKKFNVCPMNGCPIMDFIKVNKDDSKCFIEEYENDLYCNNCVSNYENSLVLLFLCVLLTVVLIFLSKKLVESYICCF